MTGEELTQMSKGDSGLNVNRHPPLVFDVTLVNTDASGLHVATVYRRGDPTFLAREPDVPSFVQVKLI